MEVGAVMIGWLQRKAIVILGGLLAIVLVVAAVQTVRIEGFGIWPLRIEGLQDKADRFEREWLAAKQQLKDAKANLKASEELRMRERQQDTTSFTDQAQRCAQRITTARDAAKAIEEITHGQAHSTVPAATRGIVPAGQLRRVIGQAAPAQATGVPAGGNGTAKR